MAPSLVIIFALFLLLGLAAVCLVVGLSKSGPIRKFAKDYKDPLQSVIGLTGIAVAIVGFGFTILQIDRATQQLQSANEYTIRKDLRELSERVRKEHIVNRDCVKDAKCSDAERRSVELGVGLIFNFHHSVYLQSKAQGISDKFKDQMARDFCKWFESPIAKKLWDSQVQSGGYDRDRVTMREEWCK